MSTTSREKFQRLIASVQELPAMPTAVAHRGTSPRSPARWTRDTGLRPVRRFSHAEPHGTLTLRRFGLYILMVACSTRA